MSLSLNMGAFGSGYAGAATPAAAQPSPQGPTSIGQKAFGIVTPGDGSSVTPGIALASAGVLALAGLWWIWYSLPR